MSRQIHKKSLYEDISDVVFVPKKKSLIRKVLILLTIILLLGGIATAVLYNQGFLANFNSIYPKPNLASEINSDNQFETIRTFVRKPCGLQEPGEEHYTDWFEIHSNKWRINLTSERIIEDKLSNVRVWYTTSSEPILEGGIYTEAGEGHPNYDLGNKKWEYDTFGVGLYRLRILCWNANYSIEVQDSK